MVFYKMTTKTASVCSYPGTNTFLGRKGVSDDFTDPLSQIETENAYLRSRVEELESDLRSVFLSTTDTLETVASALKSESIMNETDFAAFIDSAKKATENGDIRRVLAHVRQGISKMDNVFHDWITTSKLLYTPPTPEQKSVPKTQWRALKIKNHIEMNGIERFSSYDARRFLSKIENQDLSSYSALQALKNAEKMLPMFRRETGRSTYELVHKKR
jgi:hypothetical protein